ncbi:MAG: BCCT family transporter [Pseudomonadota bacterium]
MRPFVFWPPAVVLIAALAASIIDFDDFLGAVTNANNALLAGFGWLFTSMAFLSVVLIAIVCVSPLGAVRLGGPDATPILSRWNWFSITLCTTIATGILFWGTAEPMFHVTAPPGFAGVEPNTDAAASFALSTMFLHWSITPYAIYAVPALAFGLAFHNFRARYSFSGPFSLIFGRGGQGRVFDVIDALALFALIAGVAASLGAGVMTLAGGVESVLGISDGIFTRLVITIAIVATYVASSVSGLQKGIRILSAWNVRIFFSIVAFVFVFGPTVEILRLAGAGLAEYVATFVPRSLDFTGGAVDGQWKRDWTIYYFANWLAWAPVTAMFLGRIAYGYTVRDFVGTALVAPAAFGIVWMAVFGGATLDLNAEQDGALAAILAEAGPESVVYGLFDLLPLAALASVVLIIAIFVSFVTAMDSNTHSIAGICLERQDGLTDIGTVGLSVKVFWGVLIGAVAWIMTATQGIDGVRMLSNLGGGPGLIVLIGSMAVLIRLMVTNDQELYTPSKAPATL